MALTKEIYTRAKTYFEKFATANLGDSVFLSAGKSTNVNTDENLFAIACARYLTNDKTAYTDPIKQKEDFQKFAQFLRLNDFKSSSKQIDVGVGIGSSNNLLYKLAVEYLAKSGQDPTKLKAKLSVINKAFADPAFESQFLQSNILDDTNTFECITKQAFYKWHYSTYIEGTALEDRIRRENPIDLSASGWNKMIINDLTSKDLNSPVNCNFFISTNGAPFNTGFPVLCSVFEVGGIKDLSEFVNSERMQQVKDEIFDKVGNLFNRENAGSSNTNKYTHLTNAPINIVEDVKISKGGKSIVRFCLAFDYSFLVLLPKKKPIGLEELGDIKLALTNLNAININFNPVATKPTDIVIQEQIERISSILLSKQGEFDLSPPLFLDQGNDSITATKKYFLSEGLDADATTSILSRRYKFDAPTIAQSLSNEYKFLLTEYKNIRNINPLFVDYDKAAITEDISFYYDNSYQLLAVFSNKKENYYSNTIIEEPQKQRNNIPFEYQLDSPLSNLDSLYQLFAAIDRTKEDLKSNESGIDGELAYISEYFKNMLTKEGKYNKNLDPYVVSNQHYQNTIVKSSQYPTVMVNSTINGFFYNSNEILLLESAGDNPSFDSLNLQKEGSDIEFLLGNKTYDDVDAVSKSIDEFVLRYHYPRIQIKPSFLEIADDSLQNINQKLETAKQITREISNIGKSLNSISSEEVKRQVGQPMEEYFYNTKEKLLFEAQKQISVVAAATTDDPFLKDLSSIIDSGDLDQIYDKILTKFDWSELAAKGLKDDLSNLSNTLSNIEDLSEDVAKDVTNVVDSCLKDLGEDVLDTIETIKDYKEAFKNIQKFIQKDLKDLAGLSNNIDYLFVLDFQAAIRDKIEEEAQRVAVKALANILSTVVSNLQDLAQKSFSEATEFLGDSINSQLENALDLLGAPDQSLDSIGSSKNISKLAESIIKIDIVSMLTKSGIEPLENILNGATEIYPMLSGQNGVVDKRQVILNYLGSLSDNLTVPEFKNLLQGFVTDDVKKLNQVVADDLNILNLIKIELKNEISLSTLFIYLNQFIDNNIVNELSLKTVTRRTSPCFVNLTSKDTKGRDLFEDFVITAVDKEQTVLDKLNSIIDSINKACDAINSVYGQTKNSTSGLMNQQDKKELLQSTESLIEGTNVLSGQIVEDTQAPLFKQFDRLKFGFALFTDPLVNNSLFVYKTEKLPATLEQALAAPVNGILGSKDKNRFLNKKVSMVRADSTPSKYVVANPNNFSQEISISNLIPGLDSLSEKNYQQISSFINLQENKYGYLAYGYPAPGPLDPNGVSIQSLRKNLYGLAPVITLNINGLRVERGDSLNLVYSYTPSTLEELQVVLETPINLAAPLGPLDNDDAAEKQTLAIINYLKIKEGGPVDELTGLDGLRQEGQKVQVLASEVKKKLDEVLDESTEAVDYYMNNMFKMSGLIKKLKGEQ
jgi:hypothetical protein|tara:strand:+ start:3515 stop:7837 length:4323 start_codon:yes stop_codon:yes gene_type:complete